MPSPFPGMDPYLESPAFWSDFHHRFMTYWCDALNDRLPPHYEARLEERVRLVHADAADARPDLALERRKRRLGPAPKGKAAPTALARPPVLLPLDLPAVTEEREAQVRILQRPERVLVTLLELLSPGNKAGTGRDDYLAKRHAVLRQLVHLVELDLLVGGERLPMARPLPAGDYYAVVARYEERPDAEVYAWAVREPLPVIRIPLKAPDPDLELDLQAVFTTAYDRGRYAPNLAYRQAPPAPLRQADVAWARKLARSAQP